MNLHRYLPALLAIGSLGISAALAADNTPQFDKAPGAIISGLSGLVNGTSQALTVDRSNDRLSLIRRELTAQLLEATPATTKIALNKQLANPASSANDYRLSSTTVLCNSRGIHTVVAADAAYLSTFTSTIDKFATSPKIETISDALNTVLRNYSIAAPPGQRKPETAAAVVQHCKDDFNNWPALAYGQLIHRAETEALAIPVGPIAALDTALSSVAALYNALVTILTPIIVTPAKAFDAQERATAITSFFIMYRTTLLNAAQSLATNGSKFATAGRLEALSQFSEKMAVLRSTAIDLSNVEPCKRAIPSPLLRTAQGLVGGQPGGPLFYIPNDDFVMCYAGAWKQISDAVNAVLVAADQCDKFADASDDDLQKAVKQIQDNIAHLNDPPGAPELGQIFEGAGKLIAYGQTVSQALSQDNLDKAQKAINDLMKLVGGK